MEKLSKNLIPIAIVVAGLLIAGAIIYINQDSLGKASTEQIGQKTIDYINENLLAPGVVASLVDISDAGSVYKIRLKIEDIEFDSYVSKDGEFLFPEGYNISEPLIQDFGVGMQEQPEIPSLSQEELREFMDCLKNEGFVIYGDEECPFCRSLVAMLGGMEIVEPIYVDCAEEEELCYIEKGIEGVPTIFINDQEYIGVRSFEAFALATDCSY